MTRRESFWDRRRAAVAAEDAAAADARAPERTPAEHDTEHRSDAEILAALDLPDPDSLKMGDDFAAFMSKAVPAHLKNRALRQLWRSNPVLACVDGLNDYDDDYLTGSTGNGPLKTAYQVGKGMMAHVEEQARRAALDASEDPPPPEAEGDVAALDPAPGPEDRPTATGHAGDTFETGTRDAQPGTEDPEDDPTTPAPRRMRFRFEGTTT